MVLGCSISLSKELGGSGGKMTIFRRKNGNNGGDGNKAGGQSDASLLFSPRCEKGIFFPKKSWLCQRFGQQNHISCSPGAHRRCWRVCEQPLTHQLPQILILLLVINSALSLLLAPHRSKLPALFPQTFGMRGRGSSFLLPSRSAKEAQRNGSDGSEPGRGEKRSGNVTEIHRERVAAGWGLSPGCS